MAIEKIGDMKERRASGRRNKGGLGVTHGRGLLASDVFLIGGYVEQRLWGREAGCRKRVIERGGDAR